MYQYGEGGASSQIVFVGADAMSVWWPTVFIEAVGQRNRLERMARSSFGYGCVRFRIRVRHDVVIRVAAVHHRTEAQREAVCAREMQRYRIRYCTAAFAFGPSGRGK